MSIIAPLAVAVLLSVGALTHGRALNQNFCRRHESMARCVDEPLMIDDEDLWCPYRICGPSYVAAPECPESPEQATHKCKITSFDAPNHRCIEGTTHKIVKTPVGCEQKEEVTCTGEARVCACVQDTPTRTVLTPQFEIIPIC